MDVQQTRLELQLVTYLFIEEEGELSDQDAGVSTQDRQLSDEQNYRETVRGFWLFMGWHQVLDFESASSARDDNPFVRSQVTANWQDIS